METTYTASHRRYYEKNKEKIEKIRDEFARTEQYCNIAYYLDRT